MASGAAAVHARPTGGRRMAEDVKQGALQKVDLVKRVNVDEVAHFLDHYVQLLMHLAYWLGVALLNYGWRAVERMH